MYDLAWLVVRLLLADPGDARPVRSAGDGRPVRSPDGGGRPAPDFHRMAISLQNRLSERRARGEITREQYRRGVEALAAADARRGPAPAPGPDPNVP